MFRALLFISFLLISTFVTAQNEANIWYFGENAGLDFNSGAPLVLLDGELDTFEGCATLSDSNGNLLFYTDGITVWNRNHQIMPNGTGLNGHPSSTHSAIIVPKPDNSNVYYIFTVDESGGPNGLQYSEVNMLLDSGNGDVTSNKNNILYSPVTEKLTAIKGTNDSEYWVISHKWQSSEFIVYKINDTGVVPSPIISDIGFYIGNSGNFESRGQIKISPDGTKLALVRTGGPYEAQLFDFEASTGMISNPLTLIDYDPDQQDVYGVEFSANSKVLYVSIPFSGTFQTNVSGVYQFNLDAGSNSNIIDSMTMISPGPGQYTGLQLASDGKIYVAKFEEFYLDIIENPNTIGTGCNYQFESLYLGGRMSRSGLPPFIQSFFNVGFQADNVCEGDITQFSSNISQTYDSLQWDFGDGTTSTDENPMHTYAIAGNYEVSLSVTSGFDSSIDTKTITIYELPTVSPVVQLSQCDDDTDGFSNFDLTESNPQISVNHSSETITYHESQAEAESGDNAIGNPESYTNEAVSMDTVWARVENGNGCHTTSQINLTVSTTQIPSTFLSEFYECDSGTNTSDGIATFNFTSVQTDIEALFPVGQSLEIRYYRNESDALSENNEISDIGNYQNIGYPNGQDIYVRVENSLNNECLALGHHITLNVEALPLPTGPVIIEQCDFGNDGVEFFDTSGVESQLMMGQTETITFTYEDEYGNPLPSPLPNPLEVTEPIYNIFVTMTSADSNESCTQVSSIAFIMGTAITINPINDFMACDTDQDGQHTFDTSTLETDLFGNPSSNIQITYTDSNGNTFPSPFPDSFTTATQTVTATITDVTILDCFTTHDIEFIVSPQPIANPISNDMVCDDASNDGEHMFNLSDYDTDILNGQSETTFEVLYFESETDAEMNMNVLPDAYLVNSSSQTVFARVQNRNNTQCFDINSFDLGVMYQPRAFQPENIRICDAGNDGVETAILSDQDEAILNGQSVVDNSVSYFPSLEDAELGANELSDILTSSAFPMTIYARVENNSLTECFAITSFDITLYEQPELFMEDSFAICEDGSVQISADEGYDYYNWSTGETTRTITVEQAGQYTVDVFNQYDDFVCVATKIVTVGLSDIAIITDISTEDWSADNNSITVVVEGNGDYEFSLDGVNYQDSYTFVNLIPDEYTVYVRDKNGCGIVDENVYLMYYPKYFTPNGDGEHDFWNLKFSANEPLNKLYIFDRYGKLLTELRSNDFGWDGTFNGNELPSSDYWFVLERQNGKTYTGHFALKR